jgi:hypothetical protein
MNENINPENEENTEGDRYQSFVGLSCDLNADQLMQMLDNNINAGNGDQRWHTYFNQKRQQQVKLQHDNLNFIGNQINTLYEYFDLCDDEDAKLLLYKIEQECC